MKLEHSRLAPRLILASAAALLTACGGSGETYTPAPAPAPAPAPTPAPAPAPAPTSFSLSSPAFGSDGLMSAEYSCDGPGSSPALSWSGAPSGTREFALLMTTLPGDGTTKYNWVLWGLSANRSSLNRDSFGVGTAGVGSDGPAAAYQPPCSQGPGAKVYTLTLYALSAAPSINGTADGPTVAAAIAPLTLAKASLNLSYSRASNAPGSAAACQQLRNSVTATSGGLAQVSCDAQYAYVSSLGLPAHSMMNGITATNLQVPTAQSFLGSNAWRIPLNPIPASNPVSATDGPIGVAVNGVPIFNPCKQGGCQNGDTKVLGELDVCNGHAGRADDYHYHAAPVCLMASKPGNYWDTHPLGWALDGYAIYGYNGPDGQTAARDGGCGGNSGPVSNGPAGYSYHVTETSPYVLSCFYGQPGPDLAAQAAKFSPMRQPPVTPFNISGMTLSTDASDGYQVLQFGAARSFTTTETGGDSYLNPPGSYRIRYRALQGDELEAQLALPAGKNKTACWRFQFLDGANTSTQPSIVYCR